MRGGKVLIAGRPWSVGLSWQIVSSREDLAARIAETGRHHGVVLKSGGSIVGVGFSSEEGRGLPPSAAAALALHHPSAPVCAIEKARGEGSVNENYWMAAVSDGAVVAGTDTLFEDADLLHRHVQDLVRDFGCVVTGTGSAEFGGDGVSALPARQPPAAAIRPLKSGVPPAQAVVLAALAGGVGWLAWTTLMQPDAPPPSVAPVFDQQAELRKQAIAERNRMLSQDLSGYGLSRFADMARAAAPRIAGESPWRLASKRCIAAGGGCTYTWRAAWKGSTPAALAADLGVPRQQVASDVRADTASVVGPLGGAPADKVEATEATVLEASLPPLVDLCRRFAGVGGACTVGEAQTISMPNANLLPAGLKYRKGRLSLSGRLGAMDGLLPIFDANDLLPWVRAESYEFDYAKGEFKVEGRYVLP